MIIYLNVLFLEPREPSFLCVDIILVGEFDGFQNAGVFDD